MKRKHILERDLHKALGDVLALLKPHLRCVYFPVPNGAADLGAKLGARLKREHKVYPGVSDWVFMGPTAGNLCLELKTPLGRQSDDQEEFQTWCENNDIGYELCRSLDEALDLLVIYGFLPKERRPKL